MDRGAKLRNQTRRAALSSERRENRSAFTDRLLAVLGGCPGFAEGGTRPPVFLAALSGGADSTAMVAALAAIRDSAGTPGSGGAFPFVLRCLHVNHNIRGRDECFGDERRVVSLCKTLSVPLRIHRIRPGAVKAYARLRGTGIEAAARHFRYGALRTEARRKGASAILVAHTRDDLLETILMAVLRGAGPAGLGAMAAFSAEPGGGLSVPPVARPLLETTRAEVENYLAERGLSYSTDSSNDDIRFLRNRIRRVFVPFLDREFPHWRTPLLSLNKTQAAVAAFLASEAPRRLPWNREGETLFVAEADFFAQSPALREEALFQALDDLCRIRALPSAAEPRGFRPRRAALRPFAAGEKAALDLGPFRLERKNGRITAGAREDSAFDGIRGSRKGFSVLIKSPGLYKLEKLTLRFFPADTTTERPAASGFFASFPLVARSLERNVEIRDRDGRAAIAGFQGEIVWRRGKSRNGSCIGVVELPEGSGGPETAAKKPSGE